MIRALIIVLTLFTCFARYSNAFEFTSTAAIDEQANRSLTYLLRNLKSTEVKPGAIMASPSKTHPNYFYHWVRDAALTMRVPLLGYQYANSQPDKNYYEETLWNWVTFESALQDVRNPSGGLGEPKFMLDGTVYREPWGRPQNDGPALRAITMIGFAQELLKEGKNQVVSDRLYRSDFPANTPIKRDLEYTARNWTARSFDLWEEIYGYHFYTLMTQRGALLEGAKLARQLNDPFAANFYEREAGNIEAVLVQHFLDEQMQLLIPSISIKGGNKGKTSNLDVAVILAALHTDTSDGFVDPSNSALLANSAQKLMERFQQIYPINHINQRKEVPPISPAIGRYPEDIYNGTGFVQGGPWFLATHAFAELNCLAGKKADAIQFFNRTLRHKNVAGEMSEQYSRHNGYMQGARDLTWSYASFLTAYERCFGKFPNRQ